ncbi:MAG TPA: hypothetical protein VFE47_30940 [Tepidisphaeraceae bacterium]|jgi:plasmid stabilization system protein ParE|nr:hypothetical protein [Tepidisphaeraceae bacterium]
MTRYTVVITEAAAAEIDSQFDYISVVRQQPLNAQKWIRGLYAAIQQIMLTYEAALALAHQHVAALRPIKGWTRRVSQGIRVDKGWYFDYSVDRLPSNPPGPGSGIGGAPGFLISDAGEISVVGWPQLRSVKARICPN